MHRTPPRPTRTYPLLPYPTRVRSPHWTVVGADPCEAEHELDRLNLGRIGLDLLLGPRTSLLCCYDLISEGWPRAVPITLTGVLAHGPQRMLSVLLRQIGRAHV